MATQSPAAGGQGAAPTGGPGEYIGALISLVSRTEIRYQGFLAQIDPVQATIALEQGEQWAEGCVLSFGFAADHQSLHSFLPAARSPIIRHRRSIGSTGQAE